MSKNTIQKPLIFHTSASPQNKQSPKILCTLNSPNILAQRRNSQQPLNRSRTAKMFENKRKTAVNFDEENNSYLEKIRNLENQWKTIKTGLGKTPRASACGYFESQKNTANFSNLLLMQKRLTNSPLTATDILKLNEMSRTPIPPKTFSNETLKNKINEPLNKKFETSPSMKNLFKKDLSQKTLIKSSSRAFFIGKIYKNSGNKILETETDTEKHLVTMAEKLITTFDKTVKNTRIPKFIPSPRLLSEKKLSCSPKNAAQSPTIRKTQPKQGKSNIKLKLEAKLKFETKKPEKTAKITSSGTIKKLENKPKNTIQISFNKKGRNTRNLQTAKTANVKNS